MNDAYLYILFFAAGAGLLSLFFMRKAVGLNPYATAFVRPASIKTIKANHLRPEDPVIHRLDAIYKPGSVVKRKTID